MYSKHFNGFLNSGVLFLCFSLKTNYEVGKLSERGRMSYLFSMKFNGNGTISR